MQSAVNSDLVLSQLTPTSLDLLEKLEVISDTESLIYQGQKLGRKLTLIIKGEKLHDVV